ncbi:MAG: hypothetical protein V4466_12160 [Pseudomonadota bacterium]
MKKTITTAIRNFMIRNAESHRDRLTGDINCTTLAEQTADKFSLYEGSDYTIPEDLFDEALIIAEQLGG